MLFDTTVCLSLQLNKHKALLAMEDAEGSFDVSETASYDGKLHWWRDF